MSIIVLSPENDDPDSHVIKTLLALAQNPDRRGEPYHDGVKVNPKKSEKIRFEEGDRIIMLAEE